MVPEIEVIATRIFRSGGTSAVSAGGLATKRPTATKARIRQCFIVSPIKPAVRHRYPTGLRRVKQSVRSMHRPKVFDSLLDNADGVLEDNDVAFVIIAVVSGIQ